MLEKGDLKRLVLHEYGHKKQGIQIVFPIAFLSLYYLSLYIIFYKAQSNFSSPLILMYYIMFVLPFFVIRGLNWHMEISAEKIGASIMGREEYAKAVDEIIENIEKQREEGKTKLFDGFSRFYFFYPPPYVGIEKAFKS